MKSSFYDVKLRKTVEADVVEKKLYSVNGATRHAFKGKTTDGRNLTKFVSKTDYDEARV